MRAGRSILGDDMHAWGIYTSNDILIILHGLQAPIAISLLQYTGALLQYLTGAPKTLLQC